MSLRRLTRIALHLCLAVGLVVPGVAAPAQAIIDAVQVAGDASTASAMSDAMPCGGMDMPLATDETAPCDCCAPDVCDFSACLGVACLPQLPRVADTAPPATSPLPWQQPALPPGVIDNPLRPPIA